MVKIIDTTLLYGLVVLAACYGLPADAQTRHTSLHVALETAVNNVLPCAEVDIKRVVLYEVLGGDVAGMSWTAICIKPVEGGLAALALTWSVPTQRQDGTALPVSEIDGYMITYMRDGGAAVQVVIDDGAATTYRFTGLQPGAYLFQISTTDTAGVTGEQSGKVAYSF